jgi:hypothetical protein
VDNVSLTDEKDRKMINKLPKDTLIELLSLHIRNIWRVDGLYFLNIEKGFGTETSTNIDQSCWKTMGKIEARSLKEILDIKETSPDKLLQLLRLTSWSLDIKGKEWKVSENSLVFKVIDCGTQNTRLRKGLEVFPCREVREGYLEEFAREFDSRIEVYCKACPPDGRPDNGWCEWEFIVPKS